jgi:predicted XRE-type DNA-binding protein
MGTESPKKRHDDKPYGKWSVFKSVIGGNPGRYPGSSDFNLDWGDKSLSEEVISTYDLVAMMVALREEDGLTQKQLAERMGISQQMVSKIESLDYGGRTFSKLWRHLDALGYRPVIVVQPINEWRRDHGLRGLKDRQ